MSGTLPNWAVQWLEIEPSGADARFALELARPLPLSAAIVLAAAAAALVLWCYMRDVGRAARSMRLLLAGLRLSALLLVALMFGQLGLVVLRSQPPTIAVLIDDSASMALVDQPASPDNLARSRLDQAKALLLEGNAPLLHKLSSGARLRVYFVSDALREAPAATAEQAVRQAQASRPSSELGAGLERLLDRLRHAPPMAAVLLTDGVVTGGAPLANAAERARAEGVRLFTIGLGSDRPQADLELAELLVDDAVFVGDAVRFDALLQARGLAGREAVLALRETGSDLPLATQNISIPGDDEQLEVRLLHRPQQAGNRQYTVEAAPLEGEIRLDNNSQSRPVQVREGRFRVLLVEGAPRYEFRYLKELLKRTPSVELRYLLQQADPGFIEVDAQGNPISLTTFPLTRDELFRYDAIIVGDADPAALGAKALENLAAFVAEKGGGLALVAGPQHMPVAYADTALAPLMPFDPLGVRPPSAQALVKPAHVQPTGVGLDAALMQLGDAPPETAAIWQSLSPVYFLLDVSDLKPAALVLAQIERRAAADGPPLPAIIMQFVGAGRVLFHATDETWRWRYRLGDEWFARYWLQTIRALAGAKPPDDAAGVKLASDRDRYDAGQPVRLTVRFVDHRQAPPTDTVEIALQRRGHPRQTVSAQRLSDNRGQFAASLAELPAGTYQAWLAAPNIPHASAEFRVQPPDNELRRTAMDASNLRRAAEATGGRHYTLATASQLLRDLNPAQSARTERLPPIPLWNRWPLLALVLTLLSIEWLLRTRVGMI